MWLQFIVCFVLQLYIERAISDKNGNFKKSLCAGVFEQSLWGVSLDDLSGRVSLGSPYGESLWMSLLG